MVRERRGGREGERESILNSPQKVRLYFDPGLQGGAGRVGGEMNRERGIIF